MRTTKCPRISDRCPCAVIKPCDCCIVCLWYEEGERGRLIEPFAAADLNGKFRETWHCDLRLFTCGQMTWVTVNDLTTIALYQMIAWTRAHPFRFTFYDKIFRNHFHVVSGGVYPWIMTLFRQKYICETQFKKLLYVWCVKRFCQKTKFLTLYVAMYEIEIYRCGGKYRIMYIKRVLTA